MVVRVQVPLAVLEKRRRPTTSFVCQASFFYLLVRCALLLILKKEFFMYVFLVASVIVAAVIFIVVRFTVRASSNREYAPKAQAAHDKYCDKRLEISSCQTNAIHTFLVDTSKQNIYLDGSCIMHYFMDMNMGSKGWCFSDLQIDESLDEQDEQRKFNRCRIVSLGSPKQEEDMISVFWREKPVGSSDNRADFIIKRIL